MSVLPSLHCLFCPLSPQILFVGPVGPQLRRLMPESIAIPDSSRIARDEVHLIMEYQVGETWGGSVAPVANRFISSYDESNSRLTMLDAFFDGVRAFQPDLIVISGLHLLDGQGEEFSSSKVKATVSHLQSVPSTVPIHLEFASMTKHSLVKQLVHEVRRLKLFSYSLLLFFELRVKKCLLFHYRTYA